ncbi:MAG: dihydrofolate reductase [Pirellulaceae bacterium]
MPSSIIVAMTPDRVIGRKGKLPWRLSTDLQRFKRLTMGHHIVMGRKTFDSIGRLLPGRTTIIVSRQKDLVIPGAHVVPDVHAAIARAGQDPEAFVVGGEEIYRAAMDVVERIYLTLVHAEVEGDAYFPEIAARQWRVVQEEYVPADERNEYGATYRVLARENDE